MLTITHSGVSARILPEYGASLCELLLSCRGELVSVIDGCKSLSEARRDRFFKSSKLSPFPNRIQNGRYEFMKRRYQLPLNFDHEKNAIHGFIYSKPFMVTRSSNSYESAELELSCDYDGSAPGYPFPYSIDIAYSLSHKDGLSCKTRVTNRGVAAMPVGDGWHPYLTFGGCVDELMLLLPVRTVFETANMIPTGNEQSDEQYRSPQLIGDVRFDHCFRIDETQCPAVSVLYSPRRDMSIELWQESGTGKYGFVQVFTPHHRQSIAIEPQSCIPNAFRNGIGMIVLNPGEHYEASFGIKLGNGAPRWGADSPFSRNNL